MPRSTLASVTNPMINPHFPFQPCPSSFSTTQFHGAGLVIGPENLHAPRPTNVFAIAIIFVASVTHDRTLSNVPIECLAVHIEEKQSGNEKKALQDLHKS